jgi:roadblock/LC7 domain-containing protein
MARLEDLMVLPGVVAGLTLGNYGELLEFQGQLALEVARAISFLSASNAWNLGLQADVVGRAGSIQVSPCTGWMMRGPIYSIVAAGNHTLLVETEQANLNELFVAMEAMPPTQTMAGLRDD